MIKPVRIYGTWDEGIVLDNHMLKSIFLGYDENGKEMYDNTRTELGELVYKLKYKNDKNSLPKIINLVKEILDKWQLNTKIDLVIPVPPSNKKRVYQPVYEIARQIAEYLGKKCVDNVLIKEDDSQAKDGNSVKGKIRQIKKLEKNVNILIVDDLYSTGKTLNEICKILRKDVNVNKIYCLVMTKTRR